MGTHASYAPTLVALNDNERRFVLAFVDGGNAEAAKAVSGYHTTTKGGDLLRQPAIGAAVRFEVGRRLATEGAQIGYGALKRLAQDTKAPAAAQVAAAKALLQGAGLLDAPQQDKESKSINDMTRDELHTYIESKRHEIDKMEAALADRAQDVTPNSDSQVPDPFG